MVSNSERIEDSSLEDDTATIGAPSTGERAISPDAPPDQSGSAPDESTVGTGSYVAIGCTVVTLIITLIGIAIILISRAW